ncbi:PepSY domain-containing protein [Oricola nitratireducens]|uniref:PepSY domain-containing protein n=1 Tax=Oricola nitratireducens TaxID=2775868 RepID=UPI001868ACB0|nr:hypothetical protein [Oricola nitratireducens]
MEKRSAEEIALSRRGLLQGSGAVFCVMFLTSWLMPAGNAFADDGEGESDGGGESGGHDSGGSDSGGESSGGDHGGDHGGGDDGGDDGGSDSEPSSGTDHDSDFNRGSLDQSDAARAVQSGEAMPLKVALQRVEESYGGSVIGVTLRSTGRRLEYRFKIITDRGSVRSIRMDAKSGRFLGFGALFR